MGKAGDGCILVTGGVHRSSTKEFTFVQLPSVNAKGYESPVDVYTPVSRANRLGTLLDNTDRESTGKLFVGRQQELARVVDAIYAFANESANEAAPPDAAEEEGAAFSAFSDTELRPPGGGGPGGGGGGGGGSGSPAVGTPRGGGMGGGGGGVGSGGSSGHGGSGLSTPRSPRGAQYARSRMHTVSGVAGAGKSWFLSEVCSTTQNVVNNLYLCSGFSVFALSSLSVVRELLQQVLSMNTNLTLAASYSGASEGSRRSEGQVRRKNEERIRAWVCTHLQGITIEESYLMAALRSSGHAHSTSPGKQQGQGQGQKARQGQGRGQGQGQGQGQGRFPSPPRHGALSAHSVQSLHSGDSIAFGSAASQSSSSYRSSGSINGMDKSYSSLMSTNSLCSMDAHPRPTSPLPSPSQRGGREHLPSPPPSLAANQGQGQGQGHASSLSSLLSGASMASARSVASSSADEAMLGTGEGGARSGEAGGGMAHPLVPRLSSNRDSGGRDRDRGGDREGGRDKDRDRDRDRGSSKDSTGRHGGREGGRDRAEDPRASSRASSLLQKITPRKFLSGIARHSMASNSNSNSNSNTSVSNHTAPSNPSSAPSNSSLERRNSLEREREAGGRATSFFHQASEDAPPSPPLGTPRGRGGLGSGNLTPRGGGGSGSLKWCVM
jgi:hypothetical protein